MATNHSSLSTQAEVICSSSHHEVDSISHTNSGRGQVTWSGQWDNSKYNSNRGFWEFFCYYTN